MRIHETDHPLLYEINSRLWLREIGEKKKCVTLADIPESELDDIARLNFDLVWMMGAWQTGGMGLSLACQPALQQEYRQALPDLVADDIIGSPYAVQDYRVCDSLGGPEALSRFRSRLAQRGIGLILDFVPNHTARDHPWLSSRPEFYVSGDEESMRREPLNFFSADTIHGKRIIAHGRDPYFPGWLDTAQLNYRHPKTRAAMIETLASIAGQCDGVRCDMSMLVLRDIFSRTWGERANPSDGSAPAVGEFWAEAIDSVRRSRPDFIFIAEAYWGLEAELQALGFDYTYDKTLYDRLLCHGAGPVREHMNARLDLQVRSVRFLENHDERRIAQLLPPARHRAAALLCYASPGMRFFHEGQLDGRKVKVPVQLGRRPVERLDRTVREFYEKLLSELGGTVLRRGRWKQIEPGPAWEGNPSWQQFVIYHWEGDRRGARIAVANFGPNQAQCYAALDINGLRGRRVALRDLLSGVAYECDGDSLRNPGLYLDMAPYQVHLFTLAPLPLR